MTAEVISIISVCFTFLLNIIQKKKEREDATDSDSCSMAVHICTHHKLVDILCLQ